MWVLGLDVTVARADCGDRAALLDSLERQVIEGRFDQAAVTKQSVLAAFGCGPTAEPAHVARLWLAEAVLASASGDPAAPDLLAAAARVSPTTWTEVFGPSLRAEWESAGAERATGVVGTVRVDPLPEGWIGALDGTVLPFPATVPSGPHLLQVGPDPMDFASALRFDLPPGLDLTLDPKLPPPPVVPLAGPSPDRRGRRMLHGLLVGAAGAAMYSVMFATEAAFYDTPRADRSEPARALNNGLVIASAGVGTVGAVLFVRGAATPGRTGGDEP